jgi:hypothetical protein
LFGGEGRGGGTPWYDARIIRDVIFPEIGRIRQKWAEFRRFRSNFADFRRFWPIFRFRKFTVAHFISNKIIYIQRIRKPLHRIPLRIQDLFFQIPFDPP